MWVVGKCRYQPTELKALEMIVPIKEHHHVHHLDYS